MGAYSVTEDDEGTGGIVFAKSAVAARRIGAGEFNNGEFSGLSVHRRKDLDRFEGSGVPAWLLVEEGWHFECHGCGMRIEAYSLENEGLSFTDVVGVESGAIYCCHQCRRESMAENAASVAFGEGFLDMLEDVVRKRFGDVEIKRDGGFSRHVYVPRGYRPLVVEQARVRFTFPGQKIGAASLEFRHCGQYGQTLIGPVQPEFYCCSGDKEAFEAFAAGRQRVTP
jgi:hypothetical protein